MKTLLSKQLTAQGIIIPVIRINRPNNTPYQTRDTHNILQRDLTNLPTQCRENGNNIPESMRIRNVRLEDLPNIFGPFN